MLPFYPVAVAAQEAGVPRRTLYRWLNEGKIQHYYLPGDNKKTRKLVMVAHVREYMKAAKKKAAY